MTPPDENGVGVPLLTVATVCYNAASSIGATIDSVLGQTARADIEYLVVDGGSTDGTLETVLSYGNRIDRVVSEKDGGIYDAMNKAAALARGEWMLFMNSGDLFASPDVVEKAGLGSADADIAYGDCLVRYYGFSVLDPGLPADRLYRKMIASHQSVFARSELLRERPFDLSYAICADYDFLCSCWANGKRFLRLEYPVASILSGGFSDGAMARNLREKREIAYRASGDLRIWLFWTAKSAWVMAKRVAKSILPPSWVRAGLEKKYAEGAR